MSHSLVFSNHKELLFPMFSPLYNPTMTHILFHLYYTVIYLTDTLTSKKQELGFTLFSPLTVTEQIKPRIELYKHTGILQQQWILLNRYLLIGALI